ncbi:MAG: hypothetical protein ACK4UJ_06990 [Leptonema sp. (in: bacteria)]
MKLLENLFIVITIFIILACKKPNSKNNFVLTEKMENRFEIFFLQKNYKDWEKEKIFTLDHLKTKESYEKIGIPISIQPEIQEDGCFYYLNSFYYYNEFGVSLRFCSFEILSNSENIKNFINRIGEANTLEVLNLKTIEIDKISISTLKNESYEIIYNTFLNIDLSTSARMYLYSSKFFQKNANSFFIPKRFYEAEYAIFLQKDTTTFLYKKNSNFYYIKIKDKAFYDTLFIFFYNIKDFINSISPLETGLYISKVFFKENIDSIRISTKNEYFYTFNQKNNQYIFLFPYSNLLLNLKDLEYILKDKVLTLFFSDIYEFPINFKKGILRNHWHVLYDEEFIPLEICLWKEPCSIKDLNYLEFFETFEQTNLCDLSKWELTEINPFGLFVNFHISPYGKFIEIYSSQKCENLYNKVYLHFADSLVELPQEIKEGYFVFSGSKSYFITENMIQNSELIKLSLKDSISLIQFFPFKEKILFEGMEKNTYMIYGDPKDQIFSPIHSLVFHNESWEFHSKDCIGLINCNFAMSPGFENPTSRSYECSISEIFIGGPKDSANKKISEDEFIEFVCEANHSKNKNFVEVNNFKNKKTYYFPSPKTKGKFILFGNNPKCISSENSIVFFDLTIPNSSSIFKTEKQFIQVRDFEIKNYIEQPIPKSLNFIQEFSILLPTRNTENLENCQGNATPNKENRSIPYLYSVEYDNKNFRLVTSSDYENVQLWDSKNNLLEDVYLNQNQTLFFSSSRLNLTNKYEKEIIKILLDYQYEQYEEIFNEEPLCFIESLQPNQIEWLRICFLENANLELFLEDFNTSIILIPYERKFHNYQLSSYLSTLQKGFYRINSNECIIVVEPKENLLEIKLNQPETPFVDKYLLTSSTSKLGNGITNQEAVQIFTYIDNKKIKLCSYGNLEFKKVPFPISNNKIAKNNYSVLGNYFGNFNYRLVPVE